MIKRNCTCVYILNGTPWKAKFMLVQHIPPKSMVGRCISFSGVYSSHEDSQGLDRPEKHREKCCKDDVSGTASLQLDLGQSM